MKVVSHIEFNFADQCIFSKFVILGKSRGRCMIYHCLRMTLVSEAPNLSTSFQRGTSQYLIVVLHLSKTRADCYNVQGHGLHLDWNAPMEWQGRLLDQRPVFTRVGEVATSARPI